MDITQYAAIFKALGDETRIEIITLLKGRSLCACQLLETLKITQPTLSHHMKVLNSAGIVTTQKTGTWSHYSLNSGIIADIDPFLQTIKAGCPEPDMSVSCK